MNRDAPLKFAQPVQLTSVTSAYLDVIRASAAIIVVLGHSLALFFVDYREVAPALNTPFVKALYVVTRFGHQSVMVFLVLSGFLFPPQFSAA